MFEFIIGIVATVIVVFLFLYHGAKNKINSAEKEVIDLALLAFIASDNDFDYAKGLFYDLLDKKLNKNSTVMNNWQFLTRWS